MSCKLSEVWARKVLKVCSVAQLVYIVTIGLSSMRRKLSEGVWVESGTQLAYNEMI